MNTISRGVAAALIAGLMAGALPWAALASTDAATTLKGKQSSEDGLVQPGTPAIPFALQDLDGNTVKLEDFLGQKAVLLTFWSFFCGPCREEIPLLDTLDKKYADQGFDMVTVNLDGPKLEKAVRKYVTSNGFTFHVLWEQIEGVNFVTADAYGVMGTPSLVLLDKAGKVSWSHVGRAELPAVEKEIRKALGLGE